MKKEIVKDVKWEVKGFISFVILPALVAVAVLSMGGDAWASITGGASAPATTGFGAILYNGVVSGGLQGPIGRVIATVVFAAAGYLAYKQDVLGAVTAGAGGLVITNADQFTTSVSSLF